MRFYLLDDDKNIIRMVSNLIEDMELGKVVAYETNPESALRDITAYSPDICIIDLLMPKLDGSSLIKEIKSTDQDISFVMISQVSSEEMISEAYEVGAEFFIHKPINSMEFNRVMKSVIEKRQLKSTLESIKGMLQIQTGGNIIKRDRNTAIRDKGMGTSSPTSLVMGELGILGEKGTYDLYKVFDGLSDMQKWDVDSINKIIENMDDSAKTVKQRMRRSISKALTNIAHMGIEDYTSEMFIKYSGTLFDYQSVKEEMDLIKNKRSVGGKVNIYRFIEGVMVMTSYE